MLVVKLELRTFFDTGEKDAVILKLIRILAKQLLTQASMIQDKFPAELTIEAGDFQSGDKEVLLFDDEGAELDTEVTEVMDRFLTGIKRININVKKKPPEEELE
jgi:hypothetical protein